MKDIILFGGSFDPPGEHHQKICINLRNSFPEKQIVVVPCGPRKDKNNQRVSLAHRIKLAKLAFGSMTYHDIVLDLFDLENNCFTPNHLLEKRYEGNGQLWHFVGADIIVQEEIQKIWAGSNDFDDLNFIICCRSGYSLEGVFMPPNHEIVYSDCEGSSTLIREKIVRGESINQYVSTMVAEYIQDNKLYKK